MEKGREAGEEGGKGKNVKPIKEKLRNKRRKIMNANTSKINYKKKHDISKKEHRE